MKRTVIVASGVIILVAAGYLIGRRNGSESTAKLVLTRDIASQKAVMDLDRSFFAGVPTQPNALASGPYSLTTQFAGKAPESIVVGFEINNGQLSGVASGRAMQDIRQDGNVLSWVRYSDDETPPIHYIGVVDGAALWGRAYGEPGRGWHEGEPPAYGVWRAQRKKDK